jgi:phage virion morphogenesis protein
MTGVRMELTGADAALAALGDAAARLEHPRPLYDEVGAMLVVSTQMRFEREEDPDGNPWPMSVRAVMQGGRTMTDTARLVQSLTHIASDAGVEVGTNVVYAAVHQTGGTIRARASAGLRFRVNGSWVAKQEVTLPKRAFLGLDEDDEKEIAAIAGDWLMKPLDGPSASSRGADARR